MIALPEPLTRREKLVVRQSRRNKCRFSVSRGKRADPRDIYARVEPDGIKIGIVKITFLPNREVLLGETQLKQRTGGA